MAGGGAADSGGGGAAGARGAEAVPGPQRTEGGLVIEVADRVATVVLDRPERLNALATATMADLVRVFDALSRDDRVWAVLITGAGGRAFSAGIDLKENAGPDRAARMAAMPMGGERKNAFEAILECRKPVVAALNGTAAGGGCEVALACDVRIAAESARIGLPEAKRGMGANFGAHVLPRLIPQGIAYELLYTGELISAGEARRIGLVNRVVPDADLRAEAAGLCRRIAANAPLTVQRYKSAITRGATLPLAAALRLDTTPNPYTSRDSAEGVAAFLEKRPPRWEAR